MNNETIYQYRESELLKCKLPREIGIHFYDNDFHTTLSQSLRLLAVFIGSNASWYSFDAAPDFTKEYVAEIIGEGMMGVYNLAQNPKVYNLNEDKEHLRKYFIEGVKPKNIYFDDEIIKYIDSQMAFGCNGEFQVLDVVTEEILIY